MNYETMTIAQLKEEISNRICRRSEDGTFSVPFNTKTRKGELIEWLTSDDAVMTQKSVEAAENHAWFGPNDINVGLVPLLSGRGRLSAHAHTVRTSQPLPLSTADRINNYYRQNGHRKLTKRQQRQVGRMARRLEDFRYAV